MDAKQKQTWTFGIMCFNEEGSLGAVLESVLLIAPKIASAYEILVVDDGSTDGSGDIIRDYESRFDFIRSIIHEQNLGIGKTLRDIYLNANMENVANIPGDGQFDVKVYLACCFLSENTFVSFYRKENQEYNLRRNSLSSLNKWINRIFLSLNVRDVNWTKIYKTKDLKELDLRVKSSLIETEICAKLIYSGKKIIEIQSSYLPRSYGKSKGSSLFIVSQAASDLILLIWYYWYFRIVHTKK